MSPQFAAAIIAVSSEVKNPGLTATNPHLKNKFADLREVLATVKPVLARHGLAIVQQVSGDAGDMMTETTSTTTTEPGADGKPRATSVSVSKSSQSAGSVTVRTILVHSSGESLESTQTLRAHQPGTNEAQAGGIAITYARRYAILSLLGIVGDPDADGETETRRRGKIDEEGREAAARGTEALKAWWQSIPAEKRAGIDLAALKAIAAGGAQ